jgi:peptidoglycan/xylan/chitin deacetylase (PgdA/CDA1 family)
MAIGQAKLKRWLKRGLVGSGTLRLAAKVTAPAAAVLMYHSVAEDPERTRSTIRISKPRHDFEAHMRTLAQRFTPVSIEEVAEFAQGGRRLPPRAVAVTFDDGFADNYEEAHPVLARYGVPAAFYVTVNAIDTGCLPWYGRLTFAFTSTRCKAWTDPEKNMLCPLETPEQRMTGLGRAWDIGASKAGESQEAFTRQVEVSLEVEPPGPGLMLTWDQVRALRSAGHVIGAHTLSHPNLAHVSAAEARVEIEGSKRRIEEVLREPVRHFSYPRPALRPCWNAQTLEITREAGFTSAVVTDIGPVRQGDEPLALKRTSAPNDLQQFVWNLERILLGHIERD